MKVEIREVVGRKELKRFVTFPFQIYAGNDNWVPQLIRDEMETFDKKKNPAYENAENRLFMAWRNGKPVGRIAAIISHTANAKYNTKNMRFGWFEAIDDAEVAQALFTAVEEWARQRGLETITGPHGFCDLDPQGMLIEGFDRLGTIAGYYTREYYPRLLEANGFQKDIDYVEFISRPPHETGIPEKLLHLAQRVQERGKFRVLQFRNKKEAMGRADQLFHLLDEAFVNIYGSVPLTERQVRYYIKKYFSFVDKDLVKVVVDEADEMAGFLITMPSLSRAFQKARGRLLPFGWYHILRAMKQHEILDFYLAGVREKYRGQGVDLLMAVEITKVALNRGFQYAESNQELENNTKVQAQWKYYNPQQHKRRRIYRKILNH